MIGLTQYERDLAADGAGERASHIEGLRSEQVFIATRNVPLPNLVKSEYLVPFSSEANMVAEVDRIAAEMGETARWDRGRYVAAHDLGNGRRYEVVAIIHVRPAEVWPEQVSVAA